MKRISKRNARKMWAAGESFRVCPAKMMPGAPFDMSMVIDPNLYKEEGKDFDSMLRNFEFYNCSWETGYYAAFYSNE